MTTATTSMADAEMVAAVFNRIRVWYPGRWRHWTRIVIEMNEETNMLLPFPLLANTLMRIAVKVLPRERRQSTGTLYGTRLLDGRFDG
jgi:hypothetical protein